MSYKRQSELLSVCHVVASINEETGGPARSVTRLAESISSRGIVQHLLTLDYSHLGKQTPAANVELHSYPANLLAKYGRGFHPRAGRRLQRLAATEVDLIHNHGLWMLPNFYARRSARRSNLPLVISPRGMLDAWSLGRGQVKKNIAWHLYEGENLRSAAAFHATSAEEAEAIRKLGFSQPIAVIPNGVDLPDGSKKYPEERLTGLFPELRGKEWLLFLSRIHPKKGVDNLLHVWRQLANDFPDWHLIVAGPDLDGQQPELESLACDLGIASRVTFTGMLTGDLKEAALRNAELFVLPTHSENFGIAIAESLARSVPVVTTKGAPWRELNQFNCGWWVDNDRQSLAEALAHGMNLSRREREEMGVRGRSLVESRYSWARVAEQMVGLYEWILEGGPVPACVEPGTSRRSGS